MVMTTAIGLIINEDPDLTREVVRFAKEHNMEIKEIEDVRNGLFNVAWFYIRGRKHRRHRRLLLVELWASDQIPKADKPYYADDDDILCTNLDDVVVELAKLRLCNSD